MGGIKMHVLMMSSTCCRMTRMRQSGFESTVLHKKSKSQTLKAEDN